MCYMYGTAGPAMQGRPGREERPFNVHAKASLSPTTTRAQPERWMNHVGLQTLSADVAAILSGWLAGWLVGYG